MALNAIDAVLTREHAMASPLVAVLNLPLALVPGVPALGIMLIVKLAIISAMTGAGP